MIHIEYIYFHAYKSEYMILLINIFFLLVFLRFSIKSYKVLLALLQQIYIKQRFICNIVFDTTLAHDISE